MYMYNYFLHQIKEWFVTIMVRFSTQGAYFVTSKGGCLFDIGSLFLLQRNNLMFKAKLEYGIQKKKQ